MLWMYVSNHPLRSLNSVGSPWSRNVWLTWIPSQNATKNAGEMITRYQILFNRTRQAVITGELVEIITGATASEDM